MTFDCMIIEYWWDATLNMTFLFIDFYFLRYETFLLPRMIVTVQTISIFTTDDSIPRLTTFTIHFFHLSITDMIN
jgi:hypothetical protein